MKISKPYRQIRDPKVKGNIKKSVIRKAVKNVVKRRELSEKLSEMQK